jgi:hypothetical protein
MPTTQITGETALQVGSEGATTRFQLPVTASEQIADGAVIITNGSNQPITITSIDVVYADRPAIDPVLGIHLVHLTRSDANRPLGITRDYPPAGVKLDAIPGATLSPIAIGGDRYQIMVGLRVSAGSISITALRITFVLDGSTYARTIPHFVQLCAGRPVGSTSC